MNPITSFGEAGNYSSAESAEQPKNEYENDDGPHGDHTPLSMQLTISAYQVNVHPYLALPLIQYKMVLIISQDICPIFIE